MVTQNTSIFDPTDPKSPVFTAPVFDGVFDSPIVRWEQGQKFFRGADGKAYIQNISYVVGSRAVDARAEEDICCTQCDHVLKWYRMPEKVTGYVPPGSTEISKADFLAGESKKKPK
jgi:hypothetical protein